MTTKINLSTSVTTLDASSAQLLITGDDFLLFMGGSDKPTATSDFHHIRPPMVIPQNTGAYIKATGNFSASVVISPMLDSTKASTPITKP